MKPLTEKEFKNEYEYVTVASDPETLLTQKEKVRSAVEWLKENSWRAISNCPHCSEDGVEEFDKIINKAFPCFANNEEGTD